MGTSGSPPPTDERAPCWGRSASSRSSAADARPLARSSSHWPSDDERDDAADRLVVDGGSDATALEPGGRNRMAMLKSSAAPVPSAMRRVHVGAAMLRARPRRAHRNGGRDQSTTGSVSASSVQRQADGGHGAPRRGSSRCTQGATGCMSRMSGSDRLCGCPPGAPSSSIEMTIASAKKARGTHGVSCRPRAGARGRWLAPRLMPVQLRDRDDGGEARSAYAPDRRPRHTRRCSTAATSASGDVHGGIVIDGGGAWS